MRSKGHFGFKRPVTVMNIVLLLPSGLYREVICFRRIGVPRVGAHSFVCFRVKNSRFCPICAFFRREFQSARERNSILVDAGVSGHRRATE